MAKQVKIQPTPNLVSKPNVPFSIEEQEAAIWNKGYNVIIESAVKCPCKTQDNDQLSTCKNCLGVGWVFINSTKDRAVLTSLNFDTKYKEKKKKKLGTVSVSLQRRSYLSYMDRITVIDSHVRQSETIYPKNFNTNYFACTIYNIEDVDEIFRFISSDEPLEKLEIITDYTFERNKILIINIPVDDIVALKEITGYSDGEKSLVDSVDLLYNFSSTSMAVPDDDLVVLPDDILVVDPGRWLKIENYVISIRYYHKLQYHVLDIPHAIRNSYRTDSQGRDELQKLPVNAIARLAHYVVDALNFAGDNIYDNSYDPDATEQVAKGIGAMFIVS